MTPKERNKIKHKNRRNAKITSENDLISCEICGKKLKTVSATHIKTHGITTSEYRHKYPNAPLVCDSGKKLLGFRKDDAKELYGDEAGEALWNDYTSTQALTNSFEYKNKKYGMTEEEFDEYNKSRACTLDLMIERHGEDLGKLKWDTYIERQRYTTTLEYFIEKHGDEIGKELWNNFSESRLHQQFVDNKSNREIVVYNELLTLGFDLDTQYKIKYNHKTYFYDYVSVDKHILIEFNGDYWHANPKIYTNPLSYHRNGKTVAEFHNKDQIKKNAATLNGFSVYYIWESDWFGRTNKKQEIINELRTLFGL